MSAIVHRKAVCHYWVGAAITIIRGLMQAAGHVIEIRYKPVGQNCD